MAADAFIKRCFHSNRIQQTSKRWTGSKGRQDMCKIPIRTGFAESSRFCEIKIKKEIKEKRIWRSFIDKVFLAKVSSESSGTYEMEATGCVEQWSTHASANVFASLFGCKDIRREGKNLRMGDAKMSSLADAKYRSSKIERRFEWRVIGCAHQLSAIRSSKSKARIRFDWFAACDQFIGQAWAHLTQAAKRFRVSK